MVSFVSKIEEERIPLAQATKALDELPQVLPDPNVVNTLKAKELNSLSVADREAAYHDIHGVAPTIKEEPEFVDDSIAQLKDALQKSVDNKPLGSSSSKYAYEIALEQSPDYVHGRDLLLMFLRSTNFDVAMGAIKMIKYFEFKQYYFGTSLLGRPILYNDLTEDDVAYLRSGWTQVLPFRDMAGRTVVWFVKSDRPKQVAVNTVVRSLWYFLSLLLQDEESQKTGFVLVGHETVSSKLLKGLLDKNSWAACWHSAQLCIYSPMRLVSCHRCFDDPMIAPLVSLMELGADPTNRIRTRAHCGSQTEWMYALMSFGIPVHHAPITSTGNIKLNYFRKWFAQKVRNEQVLHGGGVKTTSCSQPVIDLPHCNDVLLGRGSLQNTYSGNLLFQQIIQEYGPKYSNARTHKKKDEVAQEVYAALRKENVRFLTKHPDKDEPGWIEVTETEIIFSRITLQLRRDKQRHQEKIPKGCVRDGQSSTPNDQKGDQNIRNQNPKVSSISNEGPAPGQRDDDVSMSFIDHSEHDQCNFKLCGSEPSQKRARY